MIWLYIGLTMLVIGAHLFIGISKYKLLGATLIVVSTMIIGLSIAYLIII